jgi:hypothetical protein
MILESKLGDVKSDDEDMPGIEVKYSCFFLQINICLILIHIMNALIQTEIKM